MGKRKFYINSNDVINFYLSGISIKDIACKYGSSEHVIRDILHKSNISTARKFPTDNLSVDKVLELYNDRKTVDKQAYLASYDDIKANDYNLNIPRYVDTSEEEEEIDLKSLTVEIKNTNSEIKAGNAQLIQMLSDLTFNTPETEEAVRGFMSLFEEV